VNQSYGPVVHANSVLRADELTGNVPPFATLFFDTEGHAYRAYDAKDGMLVLVRPDGYIGLIANGLSSVHTYLESLIAR
jgi:hypothetical protein